MSSRPLYLRDWFLFACGASLLLWATPGAAEDLVLGEESDRTIPVLINGKLLRLEVSLEAHGFVVLNSSAAHRIGLRKHLGRSTLSIGPITFKGHNADVVMSINGARSSTQVRWYSAPSSSAADGIISPALLPYESVTLGRERSDHLLVRRFAVRLDEDNGVHVPVQVGPGLVAGRLSLSAQRTVATGAAGALIAETLGGMLEPVVEQADTGFGVVRPAQWLALASPLGVGSVKVRRLLMRVGDFLGRHPVPRTLRTSGDVVVTADRVRQAALYRMTLGADVLGDCSSAVFRRAPMTVEMRCSSN